MKNVDKYRGCLIGGAAGDALGYPIEFLQLEQIIQRYGHNGIVEYRLVDGVAQITDDTQMSLFTANGLLLTIAQDDQSWMVESYVDFIALSYRDWLETQLGKYTYGSDAYSTWLINVPQLRRSRAPGITCLTALQNDKLGTLEDKHPINQSKGCGGVMRVAPIGLFLYDRFYSDEIDIIGAKAAALTHGHELGYIPAAMLVHIINLVSHDDAIGLLPAISDAIAAIQRLFPNAQHMNEFIRLIEKAIDLSNMEIKDTEAIEKLGGGWVAEETLAIAIYCSLKYQNDFNRAIIASVNHSGDSDSTGSVTGNILGAYLGFAAIPTKYIDRLELKGIILEIAEDLCFDSAASEHSDILAQNWAHKYITCDYKPLLI